ncbi:MAG: bile acid:sodium symporter [Acidobacteriota bacterium]
MFLLDTTEKMLVLIFFVTTMLSIGMQTRMSDLRLLAASKGLLVRTLLANFVAVPIAGVAIAFLLPLQPLVAGALVLLACTPGGVSSVQFTSKVKGSVPLAGATLFLLSLLAVFLSPVLLQLALPGKVQIVVPHGRVLLFLLVYLLLPLVAGMFLIDREPGVAVKLSRPVALAGVAAFVVFMAVTSDWRKMATGEVGMAGVGAMLLFILVSLAVGWFMGGPTHDSRQILATSTSMRNAALCLAIVQSSAPGHAVMVPLIAFSLLMVPPNMLFTTYHAIQGKRKARKALLGQN